MKVNTSYKFNATVTTLLKFYDIKDISIKICEILKEQNKDLSINSTKIDGAVFRCKRESVVSDTDIINAFITAVYQFIKMNTELYQELMDQYDIVYEKTPITKEYVGTILDIQRSGRLLYLEFDIQ